MIILKRTLIKMEIYLNSSTVITF